MRRWIVALLLPGLWLYGCDKAPKAKQPFRAVTTTTTRPAVDADNLPATNPTTVPTTSTLLIGNQLASFPRARLLVMQNEPNAVLLLFSDDPRDALDADYSGNRYYFEIRLDIEDLDQLAMADWHFKASSIERADSPVGVFLEGDRKHLQPYEVDIVFSRVGPQVSMNISGQFLMFQTQEQIAIPRTVPVQGMLMAELETRDRDRKSEAASGPRSLD